MHFDEEPVGTCRQRSKRHCRHQQSTPRPVTGVYDNGEVRQLLDGWHCVDV